MADQIAYLSLNATESGVIVHASVYLEVGMVGAHARVLILVNDLHDTMVRLVAMMHLTTRGSKCAKKLSLKV